MEGVRIKSWKNLLAETHVDSFNDRLQRFSPHSSHAISFDVSRKVSEPVKSVGAGLFGL